ncbi:MAG: DNA starvation/stationary phase protection protein [Gammaproteobacteria bacterium]|nr:DNA starvation/stationary phase protection protein [Gammaproteobacteria bacterium]
MSALDDKLKTVLADTYALYLKTQGYHWNVKGPHFYSIHKMLEAQYEELAAAVDELAECIVILGGQAPASFAEYDKLSNLKAADISQAAPAMLSELAGDHKKVVESLTQAIKAAEAKDDEATAGLLLDRVDAHQKTMWMLSASSQ